MKLLFCSAFLLSLLTAQTVTYRISGTVVEAGTNQPLPKALVQIASTRQRSTPQFTTADANGTFSFAGLTPGKYSLAAGRSTTRMQLYQGEEGFSTAITVGSELDSEHIVFPLSKLGSIDGTIFDEEGTGVRNAQLQLYWRHIASGQWEVSAAGMQSTKSSGQFHFGHLLPGTYYLSVQAHPWYAQSPPGVQQSAEFDVAYPVTYYPDTTDAAAATPITVTEGGTATLQITLRPVPAAHVNLANVQGQPNMTVPPTVYAIGPGDHRIPVNANFISDDKHQELVGIAPGRYEIVLQKFENNRMAGTGTKVVDLQNGSEVDLNTAVHASVSGRVTLEGGAQFSNSPQIYLARLNSRGYVPIPISSDGNFHSEAGELLPGRYQIGLLNPGGLHLQSVQVKGGSWKNGQLELADGSNAQVSLTVSNTAISLDGTVFRDEKPIAGATVLLLPETPDRNDLIRRDQSDSDGTFTLPEIMPGRYRVLAIDNGHNLAYSDPAVIKPYLQSAQLITVSAGKQPPLKINVQTRLP